jgi:hypothetical protein
MTSVCRICFEEEKGAGEGGALKSPCICNGSVRYVHEQCLVTWLMMSQKRTCELCCEPYVLEFNRPLETIPGSLWFLSNPGYSVIIYTGFLVTIASTLTLHMSPKLFIAINVAYNYAAMALYMIYVVTTVRSMGTYMRVALSRHFPIVAMAHMSLLTYLMISEQIGYKGWSTIVAMCVCMLCAYPIIHREVLIEMNLTRRITVMNRD